MGYLDSLCLGYNPFVNGFKSYFVIWDSRAHYVCFTSFLCV